MPRARNPHDARSVPVPSAAPHHVRTSTSADHANPRGTLCRFQPKEVNMMPGNWAEPGNPTPYELRVTIQTCKRLWHENKAALEHPECDHEVTEHNIKVLEKLYIHLMDYLVE
ncbi:MAG: hypothetical protein AB7C96_10475 [Hydrogenovibrio sp.]